VVVSVVRGCVVVRARLLEMLTPLRGTGSSLGSQETRKPGNHEARKGPGKAQHNNPIPGAPGRPGVDRSAGALADTDTATRHGWDERWRGGGRRGWMQARQTRARQTEERAWVRLQAGESRGGRRTREVGGGRGVEMWRERDGAGRMGREMWVCLLGGGRRRDRPMRIYTVGLGEGGREEREKRGERRSRVMVVVVVGQRDRDNRDSTTESLSLIYQATKSDPSIQPRT
jgi:hypothetical protein